MHNIPSLFSKSFWTRTTGATLIAVLLLAAMPVTSAFAASIGFFAPTTASSPGSGWSGATRSFTSNNSYSTATRSSKQLKLSNFGITSIPTGSTIDGIEVSVEGHTSAATARQANIDISWNNGTNYTTGTGTGVKLTALPLGSTGTDGTLSYGGATDKWGSAHTWAVTDFVNGKFMIRLTTNSTSGTLSVDQVRVKIYYTLPNSTLVLAAVSGNYAGTTSMSATLIQTTGGAPISGKTITFSLNGTTVGTATTNTSGVATLASASLSTIGAGDYPSGAAASFGGDGTYQASAVTADLRVHGNVTTLMVTSVSGIYAGSTDLSATLTDGGAALSGKTVQFTLSGETVGSGTTNSSGVATLLSASLSGYDAGSYAGEAGALFTGSGNEDISSGSADLTVNPLALTVSGAGLTPANKVYDSNTFATLTIGSPALIGVISPDDVSLDTITAAAVFNDANVGTNKSVLISGLALSGADSADYTLTQPTRQANITARSITVTADAKAKTYGGSDPSLTYAITLGTLAGSDSLSGSLARAAGENAGSYAITKGTLTAGGNYNTTFVGANLVISPKNINVTAAAQNKTFGDSDPALTYTSDALVGADAFSGTLSREIGENTGSYAITQGTLTAGSNYNTTFAGANLVIGPKNINVTAAAQNKTYGDSDLALTYTADALVGTDGFTGTLTREIGENAGSYAIGLGTLSAGSNYNLTFTGANLDINAKPINVTAAAQSKAFGDADPALTYTADALVGADSFSGALSRESGENVGSYAIGLGTLSAGYNYALNFTAANLVINSRNINVSATAQSKTFGDADPALTYTVDAPVGTDSLIGALEREPGENAGSYAIGQGTLSATGNYHLVFTGAALVIEPKSISVTANAQSKAYGTADPVLTYSADALQGSDSFTGALGRNNGEDAGSYAITLGSLSAGSNYHLHFTGADLNITKAMLTVTADNQAINIGDADPTFGFSTSGLAGSEDESVLDTSPVCTVTAVHSAAGTYPILCAGGADNNYDFTYVDGTLTINSVNQPTLTATFQSIGTADGWVLESSEKSNKGGSFNAKAATFNVGDNASRRQYRAILSFNTATLPPNAIITQITLNIRGAGLSGKNPFISLGQLLVDIRKPFFGLKATLGKDDFQAKASATNVGSVSSTPAAGNWYTANLNSGAFSSVNLTGTTQFRLRFQKDDNNNATADFMKFFSGNAPLASRPVLIIQYRLP